MKLEDPLDSLVDRCQTKCMPRCCGVDSFDFSPLHIGSFLIVYEGGGTIEKTIKELNMQLDTLSANYGRAGASGRGVYLEAFENEVSSSQLDSVVQQIKTNIDLALSYIKDYEKKSDSRT